MKVINMIEYQCLVFALVCLVEIHTKLPVVTLNDLVSMILTLRQRGNVDQSPN